MTDVVKALGDLMFGRPAMMMGLHHHLGWFAPCGKAGVITVVSGKLADVEKTLGWLRRRMTRTLATHATGAEFFRRASLEVTPQTLVFLDSKPPDEDTWEDVLILCIFTSPAGVQSFRMRFTPLMPVEVPRFHPLEDKLMRQTRGGAALADFVRGPQTPDAAHALLLSLTKECLCCEVPRGKKCGHCLVARYCSRDCQRQDWGRHQFACSSLKTASQLVVLRANRIRFLRE